MRKYILLTFTVVWFLSMTYLSHQPGRQTAELSFGVSQRISEITNGQKEKQDNMELEKDGQRVSAGQAKGKSQDDKEEMLAISQIASSYSVRVKKINHYIRAAAHIVCFIVLSVLLLLTGKEWAISVAFSQVFLISWAILDEVTKIGVAGRHCDLEGITLNLLGVGLGILLNVFL